MNRESMRPSDGNFIEDDPRQVKQITFDSTAVNVVFALNACAFICIQGTVGTDGWGLGLGVGTEVGVSLDGGVEVGEHKGGALSVSCTAVYEGGGYGEIGIAEGGSVFAGGGASTGAAAGCNVMGSYTWSW